MSTAVTTPSAQLDVLFEGAYVFLPAIDDKGLVTGVEVYSPDCGHPHGAVFLQGLNAPQWPEDAQFYLLDRHSHCLDIQRVAGASSGGSLASLIDPSVNHCIPNKRKLGSNWDLALTILTGPDAWTSSFIVDPYYTDGTGKTVCSFSGADIPKGKVSLRQTLSFQNVTSVEFCGAPTSVQQSLAAIPASSGTLYVEGEVPYLASIRHERAAIAALASLAGLDLELETPLKRIPTQNGIAAPRLHTGAPCTATTILMPSA